MNKESCLKTMQNCKTELIKIWGEIFTNVLIKNSIFYVYTLDLIEQTKKDVFYENNEIEKLLATQLPKNTEFDGKSALEKYVNLSIKSGNSNLINEIENSRINKHKLNIEKELDTNYNASTKQKLIAHAYFEDFSKKALKSQTKSAEAINECLQTINNLNPKSYDLLLKYGNAFFNYDKICKHEITSNNVKSK